MRLRSALFCLCLLTPPLLCRASVSAVVADLGARVPVEAVARDEGVRVLASGAPAVLLRGGFAPHPELRWVHLEGDGLVAVELSFPGAAPRAKLSPLRLETTPVVSENRIRFVLPGPGYYHLTLEGADPIAFLYDPIFIPSPGPERRFETLGIASGDVPKSEQLRRAIAELASTPDPTWLTFAAGVYDLDRLQVPDGARLRLEAGAVLRIRGSNSGRGRLPKGPLGESGLVTADGARGVRIEGRGIIDGGFGRWEEPRPFLMQWVRCHDLQISGITLLDAPHWNVQLRECDGVRMSDIKILSRRPARDWLNTDGINPDASRNVRLERVYFHGGDDAVAIKTRNEPAPLVPIVHGLSNVEARDFLVINNSAACKIGTETLGPTMENILFERFDVVQCMRGLVIDAYDASRIANVVFRDVVIESFAPKGHESPVLIDFRVPRTAWREIVGTASIRNVRVERLDSRVAAPSRLSGRDNNAGIRGLTFEDVSIAGRPVVKIGDMDAGETPFVSEIRILK